MATIITNTPHKVAWINFVHQTGATDRKALLDFVTGCFDLDIWDNMVCWPLRSTQNAGSGNTVYSLGGLGIYNGTMINSPTWGPNGITFDQNKNITTTFANPSNTKTLLAVSLLPAASDYASEMSFWDGAVVMTRHSMSSNVGLGNPGHYAPPFTLHAPFNAWNFITCGHSEASAAVRVNSEWATGTMINPLPTVTGTLTIARHYSAGLFFPGTISFACVVNLFMNESQTGALRSLYKSTLGQGLPLP